jgi:pimeloyl-ACP methyl ester carboxylesterase
MAGLDLAVELRLRTGGAAARDVKLSYAPMSAERASALTAAVNSADLPGLIDVDGVQVGTLRLGAFAPQYDPVFSVAADKAAELPGSTEDQAMLAGFCAVTREFIGKVNEVNHRADVLVLDLRGNMGGFGREARLLAAALGPAPLPATFDVFANHKPGTLLLKKQVDDPSCGSTDSPRPIVVLTDAGTRSAGELMATWLWASGAVVVGERTIGAGGGRDADGDGFELPGLGLKVKTSGNFNVFDASKSIADGEVSEAKLVDLVAQDHFAPSRNRPFAIQAAGLRPDLETPTTLADLRDGGLAQVGKAITVLRERHLLATSPCKSPTQKVDEEGFVQIGGIEQWVTVKGDSCASPIILFISGGPGNPLSPLSDTMYGAWARDFILVQWDQRGAGMTYGRSPPAGDSMLTLKQMNDDGSELAAYLAHRFGKQKVILWGSSWGSILGVHMAKSHPELFHAYLGTSQLVNFRENQAISYAKLLTLVRASDDAASLAVLEGVGTPPWTDPRSFGKVRRVIRKYEAKVSTPPPAAWQPAAEYQTPKAQADYEAGEEYSFLSFVGMKGDGMASKVDLPALGTDFAIPMFFVEGKQDLLATPDVAQRYYQRIKAPQKDLVLLEHAGHDPNQDVIDAEYKLLKERILPLAR